MWLVNCTTGVLRSFIVFRKSKRGKGGEGEEGRAGVWTRPIFETWLRLCSTSSLTLFIRLCTHPAFVVLSVLSSRETFPLIEDGLLQSFQDRSVDLTKNSAELDLLTVGKVEKIHCTVAGM